jgi:leucyl-tRNA synthetase
MICVNDLTDQNCHKREILDPLVRILAAYAPHVAEELWKQLGNEGSVIHATFPQWNEKYTTENSKVYPVAVNGKARTELEFALDAEQSFIEQKYFPTLSFRNGWKVKNLKSSFMYLER